MAFEDVTDLGCDKAIQLGGFNKKTKKANPTTAEGYYLGSRDIPSKFSKTGFAKLHVLQTQDGTLGIYGKTDLDPKMKVVEVGALVRITNTGSVPTNKGNDMLKFRVQVDRSDTIDVNNIAGNSEADSYQSSDEDDLSAASDDTDASTDEVVPARPKAPARAASTPSAERIAEMKARLKSTTFAKAE